MFAAERPPATPAGFHPAALAGFHPAVRKWFETRFPEGPTEAQSQGWACIASGQDTLVAAPTGSGKTLAGFLAFIDALYRGAEGGEDLASATQIVYVSPLKALATDIRHNLQTPLEEIAQIATDLGYHPPQLRAELRTGDTPSSARAAMLRRPPNFLVTTPESLYLLVTAERTRAMLSNVRAVIVDEIHAVARDKRGSHLALTLERLEWLCADRPMRVGLSATQRPIESMARLLVGAHRCDDAGNPRCSVVDVGHKRDLDLDIELPQGELSSVASTQDMSDVLDRIAEQVQAHETTLVFVNTRRMAERVAHLLAERLGEAAVAAHHGSLSKERRTKVEGLLREGKLAALVATASLELGIDIGPIDLVCQISSPRSLSTFIQRVGRSGHSAGKTPKGRIYPMTRDELVECCALLAGVRTGRLDALEMPRQPLDILCQQIVAECSAAAWSEDELFDMVKRATPYAELERSDFDDVIQLASEGVTTGRGQRGAHVHHDRINRMLRGRRGARLASLTSGGAIPETGDYRVLLEPEETLVGTVNEDWAVESMVGDVFLLGTASWRIRKVEPGTVRVEDARGAPPTVPFWLGEAPARTKELCEEVSELRRGVQRAWEEAGVRAAVEWVSARCGISEEVATCVVEYLSSAFLALGSLPTLDHLVIERFFDESGGMQLVVHSPHGGRLNRALGLALRKRFCATFDFELQAAASDDAVLLSLGPQHSFELGAVARFLSSATVETVLRQAVLTSPMFQARWRWNLNRSLVVQRFRGGRRNPPPIQRMESDDIMAAVFPALSACQENAAPGPIEIPDHPLVRQTMQDCLHEAMDLAGLKGLVRALEQGTVRVDSRDTTEPSPLAHEILNGRPYTFLDDAPLEERRSRAVRVPRALPSGGLDLTNIDASALQRVRDEARPAPRDPDELHDLLLSLLLCRPQPEWERLHALLACDGRAMTVTSGTTTLWCATERRQEVEVLFTSASFLPDVRFGAEAPSDSPPETDLVAAAALRGHLDVMGPSSEAQLGEATALPPGLLRIALARVEAEGFALRGRFDPGVTCDQWCSRRLLQRAHHHTRRKLRSEIEPVSVHDFTRFLLRWQHAAPSFRLGGPSGVAEVISQLQGFEAPAGAWEESLLPARVEGYRREWLDGLCASGSVTWARLRAREDSGSAPSSGAVPSRATPMSFVIREDLPWLLSTARLSGGPPIPSAGATREVLDLLSEKGALFSTDIVTATRRLPSEVDAALWDCVARGFVTSDGFAAVRALLARRSGLPARGRRRPGLRRGSAGASLGGRWSLLPPPAAGEDRDALAEAVAEQLLQRWGVVCREVMAREPVALPWREILWALRRMEARGTALGGRFVAGLSGEQHALPEAVEQLRAARRDQGSYGTVRLSAADPLNLLGIVTPGARVPAVRTQSIWYSNGLPHYSPPRPEPSANELAASGL